MSPGISAQTALHSGDGAVPFDGLGGKGQDLVLFSSAKINHAMRRRIWVFGILTCVIIVAFLVFHSGQRKTETLGPSQQEQVPQSTQTTEASLGETAKLISPPAKGLPSFPQNATPLAQAIAETNPVGARVIATWQTPIDFYGKVVDEESNPIAGARITFKWVEIPAEDGNRATNTESDGQGSFSLRDQRGPTLDVLVSKPGYVSPHNGQWGFTYALGMTKYVPDSSNPAIFVLHKKGEGVPLITSQNGMRSDMWVRVPPDRAPVKVDLLQKLVSVDGQLVVSQLKPSFREATNWSFSLSIPDGGLVENHDEFQNQAPESNYQATLEYDFNKGGTNWARQVTKQFYIVFGEPRKYGWLRIESNLQQETIFLTYAINPTGSRNLEPPSD